MAFHVIFRDEILSQKIRSTGGGSASRVNCGLGSTEYQFKSAEEEYKDSFWKQFDRDIVKVSFSTFWEFCPDKDLKNINTTLSSNLGFLILKFFTVLPFPYSLGAIQGTLKQNSSLFNFSHIRA